MKSAKLILTDSGGIQEEAPTFGVPILILRYKTERQEGIKAGFAQLIGTNTNDIVFYTDKILSTAKNIIHKQNPYGNGKAAKKILKIINKYFQKSVSTKYAKI